ncbi:hypothetical protein Vafri_20007, partial [Volvox africanus]
AASAPKSLHALPAPVVAPAAAAAGSNVPSDRSATASAWIGCGSASASPLQLYKNSTGRCAATRLLRRLAHIARRCPSNISYKQKSRVPAAAAPAVACRLRSVG